MLLVLVFAEDDVDEDESLDPVPFVLSPESTVSSPPLLNDQTHWSLLSLFPSPDSSALLQPHC